MDRFPTGRKSRAEFAHYFLPVGKAAAECQFSERVVSRKAIQNSKFKIAGPPSQSKIANLK
jgi:hypothetical protein